MPPPIQPIPSSVAPSPPLFGVPLPVSQRPPMAAPPPFAVGSVPQPTVRVAQSPFPTMENVTIMTPQTPIPKSASPLRPLQRTPLQQNAGYIEGEPLLFIQSYNDNFSLLRGEKIRHFLHLLKDNVKYYAGLGYLFSNQIMDGMKKFIDDVNKGLYKDQEKEPEYVATPTTRAKNSTVKMTEAGQKYVRPIHSKTEPNPMVIYYESLYEEDSSNKMAIEFLVQHGIFTTDEYEDKLDELLQAYRDL